MRNHISIGTEVSLEQQYLPTLEHFGKQVGSLLIKNRAGENLTLLAIGRPLQCEHSPTQ